MHLVLGLSDKISLFFNEAQGEKLHWGRISRIGGGRNEKGGVKNGLRGLNGLNV